MGDNNTGQFSIYDDKLLLDQIAYGGSTPAEAQKKKKEKSVAKAKMKANFRRWFILGIVAVAVGSITVATLPFGLANFLWCPVIAAGVFGAIEGIFQIDAYNKKQAQAAEAVEREKNKKVQEKKAQEAANAKAAAEALEQKKKDEEMKEREKQMYELSLREKKAQVEFKEQIAKKFTTVLDPVSLGDGAGKPSASASMGGAGVPSGSSS